MAGFGLDLDRYGPAPSPGDFVSRRFRGRYVVDPFGADPLLQDAVVPWAERVTGPVITGVEALPDLGPALLVANRGYSGLEPAVLVAAVRKACRRRVRVVSQADVPLLGGPARRLGAVRNRSEDVAVALRAGHLVAALLAPVRGGGAGAAPVALFGAALDVRVLPVAVVPGRQGWRFGWHVRVGPAVVSPGGPHDPLAAAELAEAARLAVEKLLVGAPGS
jgi:hypothetical protein